MTIKAEVFIGKLPEDFTVERLRQGCEGFGEILAARIIGKPDKNGFRAGIVEFASLGLAEQAIEALDGTPAFGPEPHSVKFANASRSSTLCQQVKGKGKGRDLPQPVPLEKKLFVGCIPDTFTSEDLMTLFKPYGDIEDARIFQKAEGGRPPCGFVTYVKFAAAEAAIEGLNGTSLDGSSKPMVVKFADPKSSGQKRSFGDMGMGFGQTAQMQAQSFSRPRMDLMPPPMPQMMPNVRMDNSFNDRGAYHDGMGGHGQRNPGRFVNLPEKVFIGGLPDNTEEHQMHSFMSQYGEVLDIKIINKGRPCALVQFSNESDAENAIGCLDSILIPGSETKLVVRMANPSKGKGNRP